MKTLTPLLAAIVLVSPVALSAATFEGTVTMAITGAGDRTMPMTMSIKPGFTRTDFQGPEGRGASAIIDYGKQEMTLLMPEQRMYMVRPMPKPEAGSDVPSSTSDVTVEKTNEHEKILGYTTTKYIAKSKQGTTQVWVTDQLGQFMGLGQNGGAMGRRGPRSGSQHAWEEIFRGKDAFPLRVITTSPDGKDTFKMEATAIEKKSLPDSLFQPPADFQKFDMGNMMRGMMPGMRRERGTQEGQ